MNSRLLATAAILLAVCSAAVVTSGCSSTPPPPTVNGAALEASAAAAAVRGTETSVTVSQLISRLTAASLETTSPGVQKTGLFLPAKYVPLVVGGVYVQTYKFKNPGEARGAASTVDTNGAVLGATPDTLVNVPWTGQPAFFRASDLIVIFVSRKPASKNLVQDTKVFKALESILGKPFAGTFGDSPAATSTATPQ
jgi:hypothetical protein